MTAPTAMACAEAMPLDPAVPWAQLRGHPGGHTSDGDECWTDGPELDRRNA